jgi:hypothetical protein
MSCAPALPAFCAATRGRLEAIGSSNLLSLLRLSERAGRLTLTRGPDRVMLLLSRGVVKAASYPAATEELAHLLVSRQVVNESTLQRALRVSQKAEQPLAQILAVEAPVDQWAISKLARQAIHRLQSRLDDWQVGCYSFTAMIAADLDQATHQADLAAPAEDAGKQRSSPIELHRELGRTIDQADPESLSESEIVRAVNPLCKSIECGMVIGVNRDSYRIVASFNQHKLRLCRADVLSISNHELGKWLKAAESSTRPEAAAPANGNHFELLEASPDNAIAALPLTIFGRVRAVVCTTLDDHDIGSSRARLEVAMTRAGFELELSLLRRHGSSDQSVTQC